MSRVETRSNGGNGLASVLGVVFIVLKLTNAIDWSWWWVLAPFWISFALSLVILVVVGVFVMKHPPRPAVYSRRRGLV